MSLRKMTPGGYEYLTGTTACGDHSLDPGESLADYYARLGHPPGEWIGTGADILGVSGTVTGAQMTALFGEGRHPLADEIQSRLIAQGVRVDQALRHTQLGRRFPEYGVVGDLRRRVGRAYVAHNLRNGRAPHDPIDETVRAGIRRGVQRAVFVEQHGRAPSDDAELRKWLAQERAKTKTAVSGYELVFAPPKSVSVVWAVSEPETAQRILTAHQRAVADTVRWIETNAAFTRCGGQGQAQVDIDGICGAVFVHWESRTGDPHLHTHVPISAKVRRSFDGKWTTLDGRTLHAAATTASQYYDSRLRDLLRDEGARWVQRPADGIDLRRPVWELDGVPTRLLRAWSRRSQQIEAERARRIVAFVQAHGREPEPRELVELSRRAQYATRPAKRAPRTLGEHRVGWRRFAAAVIGPRGCDDLAADVFCHRQQLSPVDLDALAARTRAVVAERHATFTRWNLEAEAHRQTAGLRVASDAREAVVGAVVDTVLAMPGTVPVHAPHVVPEPHGVDCMRRRVGNEGVLTDHHAPRYTITDTLDAEADLVAAARRTDGHRLPAQAVVDALTGAAAHGLVLNAGQRGLVTEFATSGRRVQVALAPAGTGKTRAMMVLADAWRDTVGGQVYAFGPSARAAHELGEAIGAEPHTLHQLTTALRHGVVDKAFPIQPGDLLIVDEAAMAGTHTLHTVVRYALERGADVRLVGDDAQIGAVEAGGAVRLIATDVGATTLTEVVRFEDPKQAAASLLVRAGHSGGLRYYENAGWVRGGSLETLREQAYRAWRKDLETGRETLLIVSRVRDVVMLNHLARERRVARGEVEAAGVALHDGTFAGVGDWIVTRRNNRRLTTTGGGAFVMNGDTWRVLRHADDGGGLVVRHRVFDWEVRLPASYVERYVELAYAATIHRCQGMTTRDSAHVLIPQGMTREQLYPAITRSMRENRLYVETVQHVADPDFHEETPPERQALRVLAAAVRNSDVEFSATQVLRDHLARTESLATLLSHHDYGAEQLATARHRALLARLCPTVLTQPDTDDDGLPELLEYLREREDVGWQADRLVPHALARGPLPPEDPAKPLLARVRAHTANSEPPAPIREPLPEQITRWQALVAGILSTVDVTTTEWDVVWWHAAAGEHVGLDADNALLAATHTVHRHPRRPGAPAHEALTHALVAQFHQQKQHNLVPEPVALPWMHRLHHGTVHPVTGPERGLESYLCQVNQAVGSRVAELRLIATHERPVWARPLGSRPTDPTQAARWDHALGLAAAYRDTYAVTDKNRALGARPSGAGRRAHAYHAAHAAWCAALGQPVTTPVSSAPHFGRVEGLPPHLRRHSGTRPAASTASPPGAQQQQSTRSTYQSNAQQSAASQAPHHTVGQSQGSRQHTSPPGQGVPRASSSHSATPPPHAAAPHAAASATSSASAHQHGGAAQHSTAASQPTPPRAATRSSAATAHAATGGTATSPAPPMTASSPTAASAPQPPPARQQAAAETPLSRSHQSSATRSSPMATSSARQHRREQARPGALRDEVLRYKSRHARDDHPPHEDRRGHDEHLGDAERRGDDHRLDHSADHHLGHGL
ncbi:MobF family relaxase [Streptoalloteichus hindustanus]|nr:MobF family relaxase [Streptoalloteichus hindustanus]